MDTERATRAISLVLVSSVLVFAGWGTGSCVSGTGGPRGTASYYHGGHGGGSHWWYHSGGYYSGGGPRVGGGGLPPPGRGGSVSPSIRGGFGSFGRGAGA